MAVYKIFPTKDTTLYSNYPSMNTGLDAICETTNTLNLDGNPGASRFLTQFDTLEIQDIINNKISGDLHKVYFKNFIATAEGINIDTSIEILTLAQQWNNGTGYFLDSPQTTDGASWYYPSISGSGYWLTSGSNSGYYFTSSFYFTFVSIGGGNFYTGSAFKVTESFGLRTVKDIEVDVSNIVNNWYSSSIPNYGFLVKLTGSQEFNPNQNIQPILKYYSVDTNTIYPPQLEFRWRDYSSIITGSSPVVTTTNLNYLPTSSYYALKDLATNEFVINFDDQYTQISSDSIGNYFDIYMSGLEPERYYKILIKTLINNSTLIFDDNYYFKVIN